MIDSRPRRSISFRRANALARLAKAGYPDAMEALAWEIYGLTEVLISRKNLFLLGADDEDLIQEGISRLPNTMADWDESVTQFTTFAAMTIWRDLLEAITRESRIKHQMHLSATSLNESVGYGTDDDGGDDRLALWVLPDISGLGANPADVLCTGDGDGNWVLEVLREQTSELEAVVTERCILGREDYKSVAASL